MSKININRKIFKVFPEHSTLEGVTNVKLGIDPTGSRLHLGHWLGLRELRKLTSVKVNVSIVIGTLTGKLGDPSGRNEQRPILSDMVIENNADSIEETVRKLIPHADIVRNGNSTISVEQLFKVLSKFTVNKLMSRDEFKKRKEIGSHELFVPILQAIDSVLLDCDLEIGGNDQLFNFSITRDVQKHLGQKQQSCVLVPIIEGTDGRKMSKSFNNCIFVDDKPEVIRQKILMIPDEVAEEWIRLFDFDVSAKHPKERKEQLAKLIIEEL